jgi:hypothetical protein
MQSLKIAKYIAAAIYFVFALLYFNSLLHYAGDSFKLSNRVIGATLFLIYFLSMTVGILFSKKFFAKLSCFNFALMLFLAMIGLFKNYTILTVLLFFIFLIGLLFSITLAKSKKAN